MTAKVQPVSGYHSHHSSTFINPASNPQFTYQDLISFHISKTRERLEKREVNELSLRQSLRNHKSAIKRWMTDNGIDHQTVVGEEFGINFDANLAEHLDRLHGGANSAAKGLTNSTLYSRKSILTQFKRSYQVMLKSQGLPADFSEALRVLLKNSSQSISAVAREAGIVMSTLHQWVRNEKHPSFASRASILKLEVHFNLQPETLLSRAMPLGKRKRPPRRGQTAYGKKCQELRKDIYHLRDFSPYPSLEAEWNDLLDFKSSPYEPHGMKRNGHWSEDQVRKINPTGNRFKIMLASFFGFLCLNRKIIGIPKLKKLIRFDANKLTLALLSIPSLVEAFIEFTRIRSGGEHTKNTLTVLTCCCSMLRKDTGYLRQHPELGQKLFPPVPVEHWDSWCEEARERFTAIIRNLEENNLIQYGRDVEEPIAAILDMQHPIDALHDMADAIEANMPPAIHKALRAAQIRNLLLVRLLTLVPLRIKHFSLMTYRENGRGNLYQRQDSSWALHFNKRDFKNYKRRDHQKHYRVALPKSVWALIENYLFNHRQHLCGWDKCDFVFRPVNRAKSNPFAPIDVKTFSSLMQWLTQYYIPGCPGFGPHAFRHIVATDYIKNHPEGFEVAARVLHDRVETVRETYSHVKTSDYFLHWFDYCESRRIARRVAKQQEGS